MKARHLLAFAGSFAIRTCAFRQRTLEICAANDAAAMRRA
jgi:hypothetical protein